MKLKLDALQKQLHAAEAQQEKQAAEYGALTEKHRRLRRELETERETRQSNQQSIARLDAENQELHSRVDHLTRLTEGIGGLAQELAGFRQKNIHWARERAQLQGELATVRKEADLLRHQLATAKRRAQRLEELNREAEEANERVPRRLDKLVLTVEKWGAAMDGLAKLNRENAQLLTLVESLQAEQRQLIHTLEEQDSLCANAMTVQREYVDTLAGELGSTKKKNRDLERRIAQLRDQVDAAHNATSSAIVHIQDRKPHHAVAQRRPAAQPKLPETPDEEEEEEDAIEPEVRPAPQSDGFEEIVARKEDFRRLLESIPDAEGSGSDHPEDNKRARPPRDDSDPEQDERDPPEKESDSADQEGNEEEAFSDGILEND